jgi:hypothetical protein
MRIPCGSASTSLNWPGMGFPSSVFAERASHQQTHPRQAIAACSRGDACEAALVSHYLNNYMTYLSIF